MGWRRLLTGPERDPVAWSSVAGSGRRRATFGFSLSPGCYRRGGGDVLDELSCPGRHPTLSLLVAAPGVVVKEATQVGRSEHGSDVGPGEGVVEVCTGCRTSTGRGVAGPVALTALATTASATNLPQMSYQVAGSGVTGLGMVMPGATHNVQFKYTNESQSVTRVGYTPTVKYLPVTVTLTATGPNIAVTSGAAARDCVVSPASITWRKRVRYRDCHHLHFEERYAGTYTDVINAAVSNGGSTVPPGTADRGQDVGMGAPGRLAVKKSHARIASA